MRIARFALVLGLTVTISGLGLPRDSIAAPETSRLLTFEDSRTAVRIAVETDMTSPEIGRFSVVVPEQATYLSVGRAFVTERRGRQGDEEEDEDGEEGDAGNILTLRYDGEIDVVEDEGETRVLGRLQGHIDLKRMTAQFSFWIPGASRASKDSEDEDGDEDDEQSSLKFTIVSKRPSTAGLRGAAESFAEAMLTSDWGRIYELASTDLRGSDTREQFVLSATQQASEQLAAVEIENVGAPVLHAIGVTYAVITVNVTSITTGGESVASYDAYFVREGTDWKLWFTAER